jgi:hypothetical protein
MTKPIRIQRRRVKGWRMPPNTVYVGRPSRWGNPWRVGQIACSCRSTGECSHNIFRCSDAQTAVDCFRDWSKCWTNPRGLLSRLPELRGKNLACFCALDQPCHADVLLELANA